MNKEKKEVVKVNQITEGVIWQQILIFFLPILFGTFFQQLYNTADAMIVGHFLGKQALAAVGGTTGTLINLLVGFFVGLSSGATVVISQHYGANKEDKVQWAVHTSIAFSILGGIVLTVVGIGCSRWMLDLMNTPDDVVNHALIYMRVYSWNHRKPDLQHGFRYSACGRRFETSAAVSDHLLYDQYRA